MSTAPYQRHSDTSRQAADAVSLHLAPLEQKVLDYLVACGPHGSTDNEGIDAGVVGPNTYRARRIALMNTDYVKDSDRRRDGCTVWVATAKAMQRDLF